MLIRAPDMTPATSSTISAPVAARWAHRLGWIATLIGLAAAALVLWIILWRPSASCDLRTRCAPRSSLARPPLAALPGLPVSSREGSAPAAVVTLLPADEARRRNRMVAFAAGPVAAAAPFRFSGSEQDRQRARQCLATAMLYEAGPDARGQRAVAQVVLNRVRHPAFPHSVCGVVYQGSERRTGCQFTFTCDGALRRTQPAEWMEQALERADKALGGDVFAPVGLATHYHTDWVYPYWSPSLDKVAAIDTHLFFRWPNYWGTRAAFVKRYEGNETPPGLPVSVGPGEADAAASVPADGLPVMAGADGVIRPPLPDLPPPNGLAVSALRGDALKLVHPQGGAYILALRPGLRGEDHIGVALRLCRSDAFCHVMGWLAKDRLPRSFPVPPESRAAMSFSYFRDSGKARDETRFDCTAFPRSSPEQCL